MKKDSPEAVCSGQIILPQTRLTAFCPAYKSSSDMITPTNTITALVDYIQPDKAIEHVIIILLLVVPSSVISCA